MARAQTDVSGSISANTEWQTSGSPYLVSGDLTVQSGVTLTVDAGVVVKSLSGAILIEGVLNSMGTSGSPVYFTSTRDNTVGPVSPPPGFGPGAGDWVGLQFVNAASASALNNTVVHYAGGYGTQYGEAANNVASVRVVGLSPVITGGEISMGADDGIHLESGASSLYLTNVFVSSHGWTGLNASGMTQGSIYLQGNRFSKNGTTLAGGAAISINPDVFPVDLGGNVMVPDNTINAILVSGGVMYYSGTWPSFFPYIVTGDFEVGTGTTGVTLTMAAGTTVKTLNYAFGVADRLVTQGTPSSPVTFTSRYDMTAGGVSELTGFGPGPGNWVGLQFVASAGASVINNTMVRYAGGYGTQFGVPQNQTPDYGPDITLRGVSPVISGGAVAFSATEGIHLYSGSVSTITNVSVLSNVRGIVTESASQPTINFCIISGNTHYGVENLDGSVTVNARQNYWGSPSGPTNSGNPGGTGDVAFGNVDYSNFLTSTTQPPVITSISLANNQIIQRPLTVSAQATDGAGVAAFDFSVDGTLVSSSPASGGTGSFFFDTRLLANGIHALTVTAVDVFNNQSSTTLTETISYAPPDAPAITSPGQGFTTMVATINVTGTADNTPALTVQFQSNGLDLDTAAVVSGNWAILPETLQQEGNNSLTAIVYELEGFSQPSSPVNGVFSNMAPQPPQLPEGLAGAGGVSQLSWSAPTTGTTPAFYRVYRSTDDTLLISGNPVSYPSLLVADQITSTSYDDTPAVDGLYYYAMTAVDGVGNESLLSDVVYVLTDRIPPSAQVIVSTPAPWGVGLFLTSFVISENLAEAPIFTFTPPGGEPTGLNLTPITATLWQATVTVTAGMGRGLAQFAFQGIDFDGNVGTALSSASVQINTIGPAGVVAISKTSPLSTGTLTFNLSLDESAASTPTLVATPSNRPGIPITLTAAAPFDGTAWTGSVVIDTNTGDGLASLSYSGIDALGNVNTVLTGTTSFTIDTIPPNPPRSINYVLGPGGAVTLTWSAPLTGERPAYYDVYRDGVQLSTQVIPSPVDGSGSYMDVTTQGSHQYQISSVDLAGNQSALTDPVVTALTTPPSPPIGVNAVIISNQVEVSWAAGSTNTATFNLYRSTYTLPSTAAAAPFRNVVSTFTDDPTLDAVYHYAVTGLDSVGNESVLSTEAVVTWAQGAPSVQIFGVANGAYYNANVQPTYSITDLILATNTVSALLDGQNFVSGSTVSAQGPHTLVVSAANTAGHYSTATISFVIVKTPPTFTFSVANGALITGAVPVSIQITVNTLYPGTSSFILTNQTLGTSGPYLSSGPIVDNGQYLLSATATDLAGNVSSATLSFAVEVGPLAPLNLSVAVSNVASLSWQSPEPDVAGYRVYRDGALISSALLQSTFFQDTGYTPGGHVYTVSAVDSRAVEGPKARATVINATLSFTAPILTHGFFDALQMSVLNGTTQTLSIGPGLVEILTTAGVVATATAPAVSVNAGQTGVLSGVVATPLNLPTSAAQAYVSLPTDAGASVSLAANIQVQAQGPAQPLIQVFPGALVPGTYSPVRVQLYNRGSAPMNVITAQIVNSTYAPVNNVAVSLLTTQGTLLASAGLEQTTDGAGTTFFNGQQVFFVTIPAGSSFLFDPVQVLVPNTVVQSLNVQATVSTPTYNLAGVPVAGTEGFTSSVAQGVVSQVAYTATAVSDKCLYDQGSSVTIRGQALSSVTGYPVPNIAVTAHVVSNGYDRDESAVTDSSGNYVVGFFPLPNEAGLYELSASAPSVATYAAQSSFTIQGLSLPQSFTATMSQNSSYNFTAVLANTGANTIYRLSASTQGLSGSGVSLALTPGSLPSTLAPGAQATLALTVTAAAISSTSTITLTITESHGFVRVLTLTAIVEPSQVIPNVTPQQFTIGMLGGTSRTVSFVVQNQGFQTWQSVTLTAPALSWASIQGGLNLGNIPPGGNANFTLQLSPPSNLPNGTYSPSPLIQITSLNVAPVPILGAITITSSLTGSVVVSVINADKPANPGGGGVPVPGAKVSLVSLDVTRLSFTAIADINGSAAFNNVPSGNYAWNVSATGFNTVSGTAVFQPGITNQIQALLPTATVSYNWTVTPTNIQDQYNIVLNLTFQTNVNAPALVMNPTLQNYTLNNNQTGYGQFTLINQGLVSEFNVSIGLGSDPHLKVTLPFTTIPQILPGQTVVVPYSVFFDPPPSEPMACGAVPVAVSGSYDCGFNGNPEGATAANGTITGGNGCPTPSGTIAAGKPTPSPQGPAGYSNAGGGGGLNFVAMAATTGGTFASCGGGGPTASASNGSCPPGTCCGGGAPGLGAAPGGPVSTTGADPTTGAEHPWSNAPIKFPPGSPAMGYQPVYNSGNPIQPLGAGGANGAGWSPATSAITQNADGSFTRTNPNGSQQTVVPLAPLNQPQNGSGPQFSVPVQMFDQLIYQPSQNSSTGTFTQLSPDGTVTQYQAFGSSSTYLPVLLTDRNGNTITYTRNPGTGNLIKETDIHGRVLNFSYNAQGELAAVSDSAGRSTSYSYDNNGNMISETDVNGDVTQYSYDGNHRMKQITYPNGGHRWFHYDSQGRVSDESDDYGNNKNTFVYQTSSTFVTDALGHQTQYDWFSVQGSSRISRVVDANGGVTLMAYDSNLNLISQTDPLSHTTKAQYDSTGNITALTDANGNSSQSTYNNFAEPTAQIDQKSNKTTLTYDANGDLITSQDALGDLSNNGFDAQGHLTSAKDSLGDTSAFGYDGNGALASATDPLNRTDGMSNDALSRLILNTDPAGNKTNFSYDNAGNMTQLKNALNGLTAEAYQTGRQGRDLRTLTDANGHATSFAYDLIGRRTSSTNALNQTKSTTYDKKSNLHTLTSSNGQVITFTYDNLDREIAKTLPEGEVQYQYDAAGNITYASYPNGSSISDTYDNLDRIVKEVQTLPSGFSATLNYSYDANSNRTNISSPWGSSSYYYDALNHLIKITNQQGQTITLTYDALGRRISTNYPNGIQTSYAYDAASQLAQIVHRRTTDNTVVAFANYTFDLNGNRLTMQDLAGTHSYSYDNLHRLTGAVHPSMSNVLPQTEVFNYDAVGNTISDALGTGYTYDSANELQQDSRYIYTYDGNGNQASRQDRVTNAITTLAYDSENNLIQVNMPDGSNVSYKYDALGRRVQRAFTSATGSTSLIQFIYDNDNNILATVDNSGTLIAMFLNSNKINEPFIFTKNGQEYFYHADALGSIVAVTDNLGNEVESVQYTVHGLPTYTDMIGPPTVSSQSAIGSPYGFAGSPFDSKTGLYFHVSRYRDPINGRFLSPDPIGFVGQDTNLYAYVFDNPTNLIDPRGTIGLLPTPIPTSGPFPPGGGHPPTRAPPPTSTTPPAPPQLPPGGFTPAPPTPTYCPRKNDIKFIDYLVKKYDLDKCQRQRLHQLITGQNYTEEEIEEIAQMLADTGEGRCQGS